jgi:hypothetical protein
MAGIGGIAAASSAVAPHGATASSAPAPASASSATSAPSFLNLPSSYAGFGIGGSAFGQVGIANNSLTIVHASTSDPGTTTSSTPAPATDPSTKSSGDPPAKPSDPPPAYPLNPETGIAAGNTYAAITQVNERIAYATAQGQTNAVAQLQPILSQLTAKVNYQLFSGVGQSPLQAFSQPEIPYVFLNVTS